MLKRIAVVGDDTLYESVSVALRGKDAEAVLLKRGAPPAAVCAVVAGADSVKKAAKAAVEIGGRQEELLELVAQAIDAREGLMAGDSARVRDHAGRFAEALGLSVADRLTLERAALLRDVGKLRVSNDALLTKRVLSYDDWTLIRKHPALGGDLARNSSGLKDIADIVEQHHECFDGMGYPAGLEGEAIHYLARALKIVDVYCAMTSPRMYRADVHAHAGALDYLRSEAGAHFDPALVDVFFRSDVAQPG